VFNKVLKREKPRVYLGALVVVPRTDIKRHLDQWGMFQTEDPETSISQSLQEIFSLPSVQPVEEPKNNDLVLDVIVTKYQLGDAWGLSLGDYGIPLLWRPKITVSSRLYYLKSKKTKATFLVTEKMKFGKFVGRLFTWRAFLGFRPVFDSKDMEYLLYQACHKLLLKMQKSL
jgi:hypothetical protein